MRYIIVLLLLVWIVPLFGAGDTFHVLSYHDVGAGSVLEPGADETTISAFNLNLHFAWLRDNRFTVLSADDLIAIQKGKKKLPERAVLLTFDDGLISLYREVFPLLKLYGYHAVVALTGRWMQANQTEKVVYGGRELMRQDFITWDQVNEMKQSGLVEFACHSYDMHRGVPANPQGNMQPAATARIYDDATKKYETDLAYKKRIRDDLARYVRRFRYRLGKSPRIMVWPYGKYNRTVIDIARSVGFPITLTLDSRIASMNQLNMVPRFLIVRNPGPDYLSFMLRETPPPVPNIRVVHVDLDYLYDKDPVQQNRNLDLLVERINQLKVNVVYLQAFADDSGNGCAQALYFHSDRFPVKADLFNRVAWQLKTRAGVSVYAWMPVLAFEMPQNHRLPMTMEKRKEGLVIPHYRRLSIFSPEVREWIAGVYEDLARYADFDGVLFHDDGFLGDYEDAGDGAVAFYRKEWKLPSGIDAIRNDPQAFKQWTSLKTQYFIDFTFDLLKRMQSYRMPLLSARNMYALVVLQPDSEEWFAQSYPLFLKNYDYTAVMAMPYMEGSDQPFQWLEELVRTARKSDPSLLKTVFELQTKDWRNGSDVPTEILLQKMEVLKNNGAAHYGYYPDDFIKDHPPLKDIRQGMSLLK